MFTGHGENFYEEVAVGAACILSPHADVEPIRLREFESPFQLLLHPLPRFVDLVLNHDVRDGEGDVDCFDAAGKARLDVRDHRAVPGDEPRRQTQLYESPDRRPLLFPHRRNAAFQFVDPHGVQMPGDGDLLPCAEHHTRGLLAVAQGCIADTDLHFFTHVASFRGTRAPFSKRDGRRCPGSCVSRSLSKPSAGAVPDARGTSVCGQLRAPAFRSRGSPLSLQEGELGLGRCHHFCYLQLHPPTIPLLVKGGGGTSDVPVKQQKERFCGEPLVRFG